MMLSDTTIRVLAATGIIGITPFPPDNRFQPASVDLTLGGHFLRDNRFGTWEYNLDPGMAATIEPGECILATTAETVRVPRHLVARVEGKSSWGRRFLMVHATAGFVDPGFEGQITLELHNLSRHNLHLTVGESIAQISFTELDAPAARPYGNPELGSRYQHQTGATPAKAAPDTSWLVTPEANR